MRISVHWTNSILIVVSEATMNLLFLLFVLSAYLHACLLKVEIIEPGITDHYSTSVRISASLRVQNI